MHGWRSLSLSLSLFLSFSLSVTARCNVRSLCVPSRVKAGRTRQKRARKHPRSVRRALLVYFINTEVIRELPLSLSLSLSFLSLFLECAHSCIRGLRAAIAEKTQPTAVACARRDVCHARSTRTRGWKSQWRSQWREMPAKLSPRLHKVQNNFFRKPQTRRRFRNGRKRKREREREREWDRRHA